MKNKPKLEFINTLDGKENLEQLKPEPCDKIAGGEAMRICFLRACNEIMEMEGIVEYTVDKVDGCVQMLREFVKLKNQL